MQCTIHAGRPRVGTERTLRGLRGARTGLLWYRTISTTDFARSGAPLGPSLPGEYQRQARSLRFHIQLFRHTGDGLGADRALYGDLLISHPSPVFEIHHAAAVGRRRGRSCPFSLQPLLRPPRARSAASRCYAAHSDLLRRTGGMFSGLPQAYERAIVSSATAVECRPSSPAGSSS